MQASERPCVAQIREACRSKCFASYTTGKESPEKYRYIGQKLDLYLLGLAILEAGVCSIQVTSP